VLYGCIISDSLLSSGGNEGQREARLACVHGLLVPPR
jgi:hypothetical protein